MDGLGDPAGTGRAVLAAGDETGEFVALTNTGIFRSHDAARTWQRLAIPWPEESERTVGRGLAIV
jgi:hypothetical protein